MQDWNEVFIYSRALKKWPQAFMKTHTHECRTIVMMVLNDNILWIWYAFIGSHWSPQPYCGS